MTKLDRLITAIAYYEGWKPAGAGDTEKGSLSWNFHNPGALRKSPFEVANKQGFSVFNTDQEGMFALKWDIQQKAKGNTSTGLNADSTLRELIFVYAPPSDGNDSEKYLKEVLTMTGFSENMKLGDLV